MTADSVQRPEKEARMLVLRTTRRPIAAIATLIATAAVLVLAASARADAYTFTDVQTFKFTDFGVTNPCNGETVILNGTATIVYHLTVDAAGGLHGAAATSNGPVTQIAGGGTGVVTGTKYRFSVVSFL